MRKGALALIGITLLLSAGALLRSRAGVVARQPAATIRLLLAEPPAALPVPVAGVRPRDLRDSWDMPRSGGRRHRGIDIFARRGTPVLSTTAGLVATKGTNALGGRVVRVLEPGGEWHYYAHLETFSTIAPGDRVYPGTILGFVGDSGNARGTPPHLHYGIYRFRGGAMNPAPRLTRSVPARRRR